MALDEALFQHISEGGSAVRRGFVRRAAGRLVLLLVFAHLAVHGVLWLLGGAWGAGPRHDLVVATGRILLPVVAAVAACTLAFLASVNTLIVSGTFLRSLGDLILRHATPQVGLGLSDQFARLASPQGLSRLARLRDLPLIVLLARSILRVDLKPALQAAESGMGREAVVRQIESQARDRAVATIRRLKRSAMLALACAMMLPFVIGWFVR